jgi:drug/metabolite transporter (DMT)-like permease
MWIVLSIAGAFTNAFWTSMSKPIVQDVSPVRMQLLHRLTMSCVFLVPFILLGDIPASTAFWVPVVTVGVLHAARWVVVLHGVKRDYFSTYALYNTTPLFTILLAPTLLPEKFGLTVWAGIVIIIAGGWLFYRTSRVSVHGLIGALIAAGINVLSKYALDMTNPVGFAFLFQATATVVLAAGYVASRKKESDSAQWFADAKRILPLALVTCAGALCFYYALSLDTATRVTAVVRTNLIFGFVLSYLVLKERANLPHKITGALLILAGTILVAL